MAELITPQPEPAPAELNSAIPGARIDGGPHLAGLEAPSQQGFASPEIGLPGEFPNKNATLFAMERLNVCCPRCYAELPCPWEAMRTMRLVSCVACGAEVLARFWRSQGDWPRW